jgi:hypothetical protein
LAAIFALSLGTFLPTSFPVQMVSAGKWTLAVSSLATQRLRSVLARWWILRSLPVPPTALLRMEVLLPWLIAIGSGWLGIGFCALPAGYAIMAACLLPFTAASAALAAAGDILRRSQARAILSPSIAEENIPQMDIRGVIQGGASVLLPLGLLIWGSEHGLMFLMGGLAVLLAAGMAYLNFRSAVNAFTRVG